MNGLTKEDNRKIILKYENLSINIQIYNINEK